MLTTVIYQTLENRENEEEVVNHGPYFCSEFNPDNTLKKGVKEPWLGEGYYFWDSRIEDAEWWGETVYKGAGYYICRTTYDQHSHLLFDLVGITLHFDEFVKCAELIKEKRRLRTIKFPVVLSYLKKLKSFTYKAIRVMPYPKFNRDSDIVFPKETIGLGRLEKIQVCFFDKELLSAPYELVAKSPSVNDQTI